MLLVKIRNKMIKKFSDKLNENVENSSRLEFNIGDTDFKISYHNHNHINFDLDYNPGFGEDGQNIFTSLDAKQTTELINFLQLQLVKMKAKDFNL